MPLHYPQIGKQFTVYQSPTRVWLVGLYSGCAWSDQRRGAHLRTTGSPLPSRYRFSLFVRDVAAWCPPRSPHHLRDRKGEVFAPFSRRTFDTRKSDELHVQFWCWTWVLVKLPLPEIRREFKLELFELNCFVFIFIHSYFIFRVYPCNMCLKHALSIRKCVSSVYLWHLDRSFLRRFPYFGILIVLWWRSCHRCFKLQRINKFFRRLNAIIQNSLPQFFVANILQFKS